MFAECHIPDTRQRQTYLPSVRVGALGKQGHVCRVPRPLDTRQTRRDRLRAVMLLFFLSVGFSTRQRFCRVPDKKYSANKLLPSLCTPCVVCRVFLGFAVCLRHTAKIMFLVVPNGWHLWYPCHLWGPQKLRWSYTKVVLLRLTDNYIVVSSTPFQCPVGYRLLFMGYVWILVF